MIAFCLPMWLLRSEMDHTTSRRQRAARLGWCGLVAESIYLLAIGVYLIFHDEARFGYGLVAIAVVAMAACVALIRRYVTATRNEILISLALWMMLTPNAWLLALSRIRAADGDVVTLVIATVFVAAIVAGNAFLASVDFNAHRSWLATAAIVLGLPVLYLTLPTSQPGMAENIFRKLSLGGIPNAKLVVKQSTCDAVNVLVPDACLADNSIKVPLQKGDVLAWGSGTKKPACKVPQ